MSQPILRIATRKSPLALWEANYTADRLRQLPAQPLVELVPIVTSGATNQTDALRQFGGTGVFTREVQRAVLDGRADLAVHSLKDLPSAETPGLFFCWDCFAQRSSPSTASKGDEGRLPAIVGSSPRRYPRE